MNILFRKRYGLDKRQGEKVFRCGDHGKDTKTGPDPVSGQLESTLERTWTETWVEKRVQVTHSLESQHREASSDTIPGGFLGGEDLMGTGNDGADGSQEGLQWPRGRRQGSRRGHHCGVGTYEIIVIHHNVQHLKGLGIDQGYFRIATAGRRAGSRSSRRQPKVRPALNLRFVSR